MRLPSLTILMLFLASCAPSPPEGRAAAILDAAQAPAVVLAGELTRPEVPEETRAAGLKLIRIIRCWPGPCAGAS